MEIDINKYLTEEEIKNIVADEVRSIVQSFLKVQDKNSIERIISNSAYGVIWGAVDKVYDGEVDTLLKNKVIEIINNMTEFNVFRKPNAWDRSVNTPYDVLCNSVRQHSQQLDEIVKDKINTISKSEVCNIAGEVVKERINKVLKV